MPKSLRWRLQIWHALILASVIVGFGAALYFQMRRETLNDIDAELLSSARIIDANLRAPGPRPLGLPPGSRRFERDGREHRLPDQRPPERHPPERHPPERHPPDHGPPFPFDGSLPFGPPRFDGDAPSGPSNSGPPPSGIDLLSSEFSDQDNGRDESSSSSPPSRYGRGPGDYPPYFAVFGPRGELVAGAHDEVISPPVMPQRPYEFRNSGPLREVVMKGPGNRLIVVGRDVNPLLGGLNRLLFPISLSGLVVLAAGLLGGWWLSGRAIEPLQRISSTASSITADSLTNRIDTSKMDSELEQLGTILNSMLQRLENSFEQQVQFVADASHELRTPISVLLMHCELALSRERKPQEYQKTLTTCARASERMRSLVEDLLILARADAGQLMIRKEPMDLSLLVDECVRLLEPMTNKYGVTLESSVSPCPCNGDSNHLLRLTSNLLSNAILYNRPGGKVTIETSVSDGVVSMTVRDTGLGMTLEELAHLFERFYRADEARSRETGGSGLGLSICRSIATAHGGELSIISEKEVGTTVVLRLPSPGPSENGEITDPQAEFSSR